MVFDFTHGEKAKYLITIHYGIAFDKVYYHAFWDAKRKFEEWKSNPEQGTTAINLYDLEKDIKKDFVRFEK